VLAELNTVRHSQGYVGQPSRNRPLTRPEIRAFFGQMDPEIARLRAAGHKGALTAARHLGLFTTMYAWGLRRRETARLEIHDWRRQAKLPEFGDFAGLAVRWGKALPGQPPRRRMVISVWPWAVATVRYYVEQIRPLFYIAFLRHLADHSPFLTADRLTVYPWPGRTANAVAGRERSDENRTARIPEAISAPLLAGAVFYVQTASKDILAALREVDALQAARDELDLKPGEAKRRLQAFIARRRREGRGILALPAAKLANRPGATVVDGVVQHANYHTVGLLTGVTEGTCRRHHRLLDDAGRDLGFEVGGLDTPRSPWPATGAPWQSRLDPVSLSLEVTHLRAAVWIVIAFLSGMRDEEVRELGRDCAFTEPADDGRVRYKLRSRVYKGARLSGEETDWVVLEVVHQAVDVLLQLNDDPTHLFGYRRGPQYGYVVLSTLPLRLDLARLRRNGLITRVPGRNRYTLTTDGIGFAVFYTKVHDRVLRPLLATRSQPHAPPELRAALRTIDQAIDQRLAHARLRTAA